MAIHVHVTDGVRAGNGKVTITYRHFAGLFCTSFVGGYTGEGTLRRCPVATTGGGESGMFLDPNTGGHSYIYWQNGTRTIFRTTNSTPSSGDGDAETFGCPTATTEVELTASVTTSTNPAIALKTPVALELCVDSTAGLSNEPNSVVRFGAYPFGS